MEITGIGIKNYQVSFFSLLLIKIKSTKLMVRRVTNDDPLWVSPHVNHSLSYLT